MLSLTDAGMLAARAETFTSKETTFPGSPEIGTVAVPFPSPCPVPVEPSERVSLALANTLLILNHWDSGWATVQFTVTASFWRGAP